MCYATNPMKQGFSIVLKLHFDVDRHCNIRNSDKMRASEAPISMSANDGLFKYLGTQLEFFVKGTLSGINCKYQDVFVEDSIEPAH